MKLVLKLILGIVLGTLMGLFLPAQFVRALITVKALFSSFLTFVIPFIILLYIAHGIAGLGHKTGRILGATVGITYLSTICAGMLAVIMGRVFIPLFTSALAKAPAEGVDLSPLLNLDIEPVMSVMTALVTAFVFGVGISKTHSNTLEQALNEGKNIMDALLNKVIVPFLPYYVGCIFADIASNGTVFTTLKSFVFVLGLAISLHWIWLGVLYVLAGMISGRNPFVMLKNMLPAYFTAAGTMSSTATIPVTLRSVKNNGIHSDVAEFGVPLCATIHISGSVITITTCAIAVMLLSPEVPLPSFHDMLPFIFMLGVIMVAAPGVPGGGIMASLGLLTTMLGFNETAIGLMIALYIAQDSLGTAANVTGDGAILAVIDEWFYQAPESD